MEKKSKYLIIMLVAFVICVGVFLYQHNNNVDTVIILNESKLIEGKSFSGMLLDSYGFGVANKTISYHQPGDQNGSLVNVTTNSEGKFFIDNVKYSYGDNAYKNFTFAGDEKYKGCLYYGNVTIVASV
ncbi:hypothetical protein [uncultured Methanobrevibacter sp.]|uniref:hypothetical protein n=1 Tax=uncultured Methanobrevibacter sp. TaxID=253161 RepID=UPI0025D3562A|nr:hypothetical protein [uncultured Methanobrevibacter sp.]